MLRIRSSFASVFDGFCVLSILLDVVISVSTANLSYLIVSAVSAIVVSITEIIVIWILARNLLSFFAWIQYGFCLNGAVRVRLACLSAEADCSCIFGIGDKRKERLTILFDLINWL